MKSKFNRIALWGIVLMIGGVILNGCDNYKTPVLGKPRPGGIYLSQAQKSPIAVNLSNIKKEDTVFYNANVGGVGAANNDNVVHFKVNTSLVDTYNTEHSTTYEVLPSDNFEITQEIDTLHAGVKYGKKMKLIIKNYPTTLDDSKTYLLPVSIEKTSGGLSVNEDMQNAYYVITNAYYSKPAGNGTLSDPYKIATLDNLQWMNQNASSWGDYFIQTKDIDATDTKNWNNGDGFIPIGDASTYFTGNYDGQKHIIKGLYINKDEMYMGLFGWVDVGGVIRNLTFTEIDFLGGGDSGPVVGRNDGKVDNVKVLSGKVKGGTGGNGGDNIGGIVGTCHGSILNCVSKVDVIGTHYHIGGVAGYTATNTLVKNCYATGDVTSPGEEVGGLIGDANGTIINCYATGNVSSTGYRFVGGLVGINYGPIKDSYATGDVTGETVGGLVGDSHGLISHCYATGKITANTNGGNSGGLVGYMTDAGVEYSYATGDVICSSGSSTGAGGLVGYAKDNADIKYSFSTGDVYTKTAYVGGLVADSHSNIINSYATGDARTDEPGSKPYAGGLVGQYGVGKIENSYSTGKASNSDGSAGGLVGNVYGGPGAKNSYWDKQTSGLSTSGGGTGLNTSDMQGANAQSNMSGFDFSNVWETQSGDYPILKDNHL